MQIISKLEQIELQEPSAIAIGKFDGVHLGHRKVLQDLMEQKKNGLKIAVFTFEPSPAVLFSGKKIPSLMTRNEKRLFLEQIGVDHLIEFPMNYETAATDPEVFVREYLSRRLKARYIVAGDDVSFGDRGAGNAALLVKLSSELGYRLNLIEKVYYQGQEISSTRVRDLVTSGNMPEANELLGTPYTVSGTVLHGKKLGRTIGMPTVNLEPEEEKLLPPNGVYYSEVEYNGRVYPSITNIGTKPTVSSEVRMGVESYLYDFHETIYGADITTRLLEFKRPEMRFSGVDALRAQMEEDIASGARYHHVAE